MTVLITDDDLKKARNELSGLGQSGWFGDTQKRALALSHEVLESIRVSHRLLDPKDAALIAKMKSLRPTDLMSGVRAAVRAVDRAVGNRVVSPEVEGRQRKTLGRLVKKGVREQAAAKKASRSPDWISTIEAIPSTGDLLDQAYRDWKSNEAFRWHRYGMRAPVGTCIGGSVKLYLEIGAVPNRDYSHGDPLATISIRKKRILVHDLADAAVAARRFITMNDLGGGNWAYGEVFDSPTGGKAVAYVSYNGRVWESTRQGAKELAVSRTRHFA